MSVPAPEARPSAARTAASIVAGFFRWLVKNIPAALVSALIGAAIGWVTNVYLIATRLEGSDLGAAQVPAGPIVAGNNQIGGGLYWALGSTVLFGIVGYRRAVGGKRFWRDVRGIPRALGSLLRRDGAAARVHLLWGAAGSLIASTAISPSMRAVLALGLLAGAPSIVGRAIASLGMRAWSAIQRRVSPGRGRAMEGVTSMTVGILGAGAGLAVTYLVVQGSAKLYVGIACAALAFVLGRAGKPTSATTVVLLVAAAAAAVDALHPLRALADDGGWQECAADLGKVKIGFQDWLRCPGVGGVLSAAKPAAIASGAFAPIGLFIGHLSGGGAGRGGGGTGTLDRGPGPLLDAEGKPLTVNDGGWPDVPRGWVWYGREWVSPDRAHELIAEQIAIDARENQRRKDWATQTARDHEDQFQSRIDQLRADAWRERMHNDAIARMDRAEGRIRQMLPSLPMSQWDRIEEIVQKIRATPGPDGADRLQRLIGAIHSQNVGRTEGEAAAADRTAAWAGFGEDAATYMHRGAMAAEMMLTLGGPLAGAAATRLGAHGIGHMLGAGARAGARLGTFHVGRNLAEGAGVGYVEGGLAGAAGGAVRRTLPVNTAIAIQQGKGPGEVAWSVVQDLGNTMSLRAGSRQIASWTRAKGPGAQAARDALDGMPRGTPRTPADAAAIQARVNGRNLVRDYAKLEEQIARNPRDRNAIAALRQKVNQINADYQAKLYFKNRPAELQAKFNTRLQRDYRRIDRAFVDDMNAAGLQRGGRPFHEGDVKDVRNATSSDVGMDRDLALNQRYENKLKDLLAKATPGSAEAQDLQRRLAQTQQATRITLNGKPISNADWNEKAQELYNKAFNRMTGQDATKSLQTVTHSGHAEAYGDAHALVNNPSTAPLRAEHAAQTGSVTTYKGLTQHHGLEPHNALQEIARGTEKDIRTKLQPLLNGQPVPPEKIAAIERERQFLESYGKHGKYFPSDAQRIAQERFGTTIEGLNERAGARIEFAIKFRK